MNSGRFVLTTIISLVLLSNTISFGMITSKSKLERKFEGEYEGENSWAKCTKEQISQMREASKENDRRNLKKLYNNQDNPRFASEFLRNRVVPMLLLDITRPSNNEVTYLLINPYAASFYESSSQASLDEEIIDCGNRSLDFTLKLKQKFNKGKKQEVHCINKHFLVKTVLLGTDQDIVKKIGDNACKHSDVQIAALAAIGYSNKKNNALELLLSKIKKEIKSKQWLVDDVIQCNYAYHLLYCAARNKNKEAFEFISRKDPYKVNRTIWTFFSNQEGQTFLEIMRNNEQFNQEHIAIFMSDGYGMTTQEVKAMHLIDRTLQRRETVEERDQREFWEGHIRARYNNARTA